MGITVSVNSNLNYSTHSPRILKRGNLNVPGKQFFPVGCCFAVRSTLKNTTEVIFRAQVMNLCGFDHRQNPAAAFYSFSTSVEHWVFPEQSEWADGPFGFESIWNCRCEHCDHRQEPPTCSSSFWFSIRHFPHLRRHHLSSSGTLNRPSIPLCQYSCRLVRWQNEIYNKF